MRTVFADTFYWLALSNPRDQWHEAAKRMTASMEPLLITTTDEVLIEFLTFLSSRGPELRKRGGRLARHVMKDQYVRVVPQSRESFESGLSLYEQRPDKDYSLTDCISMEVMRQNSLNEVLTSDHHFEQEGFTIVFRSTHS